MSDYVKLQFVNHEQQEEAVSIYGELLIEKGYTKPQVIDMYVRAEDISELKDLLNIQGLDYEEMPQ